MLHASTKKLIDRLSEMTELGKLDWTDGDDGNITFATEGYSVSLTESPNEVVIASLDGVELERATVDELATTQLDDGTTYAAIVAAMTKEASRIARGTEAAISTLLAGMQDAPAEVDVDAPVETAEELQEDLVDETAIVTADAIDAVETEASSEEGDADLSEEESTSEIGASWKDTVDTETEATDDAEPSETDEANTELAAEGAADTSVETDEVSDSSPDEEDDTDSVLIADTETGDEVAVDPETTSESDAPAETETASEDAASTDTDVETVVLAETDVSEPEEEALDLTAEPQVENDAADDTEQVETTPFAGFSATSDETEAEETSETELSNEGESESEVSEAVARLADEVNTDDDSSGLATAAASAVGAVALAAGLTPQSNEEETSDESEEETVVLVDAEADSAEDMTAAETEVNEAPPAYVPFGLEAEVTEAASEAEDPIETTTDVEETNFELDQPIEATSDVEAATESEIVVELEVPAAPTEDLAQMADDSLAPHETEQTDLEADAPLTVDVEPNDEEVDFASAEAAPETGVTTEVEPVATFQADDDTVSSDESEATEAIEESVLVKSAETFEREESAPQSYSLSGIGAGFGLGALSAKTEASGLPSVSAPTPAIGEKVIIDATDDVLPKPEGNLNVALAETASAAVSAANTEPTLETVTAGEEEAEPEADILKPRTRFNPWD